MSACRYHVQVEPLVSHLPYMTAIGNHERDWPGSGDRFPSMTDSGGECGVPHERRFLMPSAKQDEP
jgi:acid phosphatase type 7